MTHLKQAGASRPCPARHAKSRPGLGTDGVFETSGHIPARLGQPGLGAVGQVKEADGLQRYGTQPNYKR